MKNILAFVIVLFSISAFSQKTIEINVKNFEEKIQDFNSKGDKLITQDLDFYICLRGFCNRDEFIQKFATYLKNNPSLNCQLVFHSDARGNDAYNLKVTQREAKHTIDALVFLGIEKDRIKGLGKGETNPLYSCKSGIKCTEEEHRQNRRLEITILSKS